jgi:hypothetical protein
LLLMRMGILGSSCLRMEDSRESRMTMKVESANNFRDHISFSVHADIR